MQLSISWGSSHSKYNSINREDMRVSAPRGYIETVIKASLKFEFHKFLMKY